MPPSLSLAGGFLLMVTLFPIPQRNNAVNGNVGLGNGLHLVVRFGLMCIEK